MSFLEGIAKYILDGQPTSTLAAIALQGLEEGFESPSLIILAGLADNESPFVIDQYFKETLKELDIPFSDELQAALFLTKSFAEKIINNKIDPFDGCKVIFDQTLSKTNLRSQDKKYVYDSIQLASVYGLYDTILELQNSSINWDKEKTNEQLIDIAKEDIKKELVAWTYNNASY